MYRNKTYIDTHKHVVELQIISVYRNQATQSSTYLFVTNGEFALGLLVRLSKSLKLLNRLRLGHRNAELDIGLCVLVTGLDLVSGKSPERYKDNIHKHWYRRAELPTSRSMPCSSPQRFLRRNDHILARSLLEMTYLWHGPILTANKQGVTGKHSPLVTILHVITNAILGVTRGV